VEQVPFATNLDMSWDGVNVSDERDRLWPIAPDGDDVPGSIDVDIEAGTKKPGHQQ
jgi:hypothetical protein